MLKSDNYSYIKLVISVTAAVALVFLPVSAPVRMLMITGLVAFMWVSEWIPLSAASLIPFVLLSVTGIADFPGLAESYMNDTILLFLGGFLLAGCLEKWNVHKRIALRILLFSGKYFLSGFLFASWLLSMWISNTATAVMMVPIGLAVAKNLEAKGSDVYVPVLIAIAYGASIGGLATPVGTPPNLAFQEIYHDMFPGKQEYSFANWMKISLPLAVLIALAALMLLRFLNRKALKSLKLDKSSLQNEYDRLGAVTYEEKAAISAFAVTAMLWITRGPLDIGNFSYPGWAAWTGVEGITDGKIAIAAALILFFLPARKHVETQKPQRMLDDSAIQNAPWGILLLFGAGFALASGFQSTGLAASIGEVLNRISPESDAMLLLLSMVLMTFLTEFASNTASAQIFLPIIGTLAVKAGITPAWLMIPVTWKASLAFMMPAGTPPNAIIFGSGKIKIKDLVKAGLLMNLLSLTIVFLWSLIIF